MAYGDPVRIKIICGQIKAESNPIQIGSPSYYEGLFEDVEQKYNRFAENHEIVASQYRIKPDGIPTICIWFKWDPMQETYEETQDLIK